MNTLKVCLLVAACVYTHTAAQAQTNPMPPRSATAIAPTRVTNEATSDTGTLIRKDMRWNSKIPLNKTYGELTPEQKEELRAMYESMPADEEPPFPAQGMKPIFNAIKQAQAKLLAKGVLNLETQKRRGPGLDQEPGDDGIRGVGAHDDHLQTRDVPWQTLRVPVPADAEAGRTLEVSLAGDCGTRRPWRGFRTPLRCRTSCDALSSGR
jgi:hypothetical protein